MRLAVVGSRGQLGAAIVHAARGRHQLAELDRRALDVTDSEAIAEVMASIGPHAIINCTGFNRVDAAEEQPLEAFQVNALAVRGLARAARTFGAALVHFSSDFVFDGVTATPRTEQDPPNPRSVYAVSKLLGEWFADGAHPAYVLRVASLFGVVPGATDKGSVAAIVNTLRSGGTPTVFGDRTVSPTYVLDAATATLELIERQVEPGLYHCVNSGWCTWKELGEEAARLLGVAPRLNVARFETVHLPAARPQYSALFNGKLQAVGVTMPHWRDALKRYIA